MSSLIANDKLVLILVLGTSLLACNLGTLIAPVPTPTLAPLPTATVLAQATNVPTRLAQPTPTWWDQQIKMPAGAEYVGDAKQTAWSTRDTNAASLKDWIVEQAKAAGYQTFVVTQSPGAIYEVLLVQGQTAFAVNITLGSETAIIRVSRTGVMHLKVSGVTNIEVDLPMRTRVDVTPGSEISIGTSIPSPQCAGCEYFINVHIAPFKGVGKYDSTPGLSIIDVELVPGGDHDRDNFRWAMGGCTVEVRANSGSFECKQLQNIHDPSQRVDVSGTWTQPANGG